MKRLILIMLFAISTIAFSQNKKPKFIQIDENTVEYIKETSTIIESGIFKIKNGKLIKQGTWTQKDNRGNLIMSGYYSNNKLEYIVLHRGKTPQKLSMEFIRSYRNRNNSITSNF